MRDGAGEAGWRDRSPGRVPEEMGQLLGGFGEKQFFFFGELSSGLKILLSQRWHHIFGKILSMFPKFCTIDGLLVLALEGVELISPNSCVISFRKTPV